MTVFKHPTGKWSYDFEHKLRRFQKSGFHTKQEARSAEAEARKKLHGLNVSFLSLCSARLEDLKVRRTHQHYKENEKLLKNLMGIWGTKKEITREDVEKRLMATAHKSKSLANRDLRLIKALFGYGVTRGWIAENPVRGIERFPETRRPRYIPPLEDVMKVLDLTNAEERNYLLVVINTMARIREINRLTWDDVFSDHLILRTRKAKCSDLTERRIPLNQTLKGILDSLPRGGTHVFVNPYTKKQYNYRKRLLTTLCKKAGVKHFTFHCLRHLGASRMMKGGVALTDIQKLLGHQRSTTTDIYLHSIGDGLESAVNQLEVK
jgi:integrase